MSALSTKITSILAVSLLLCGPVLAAKRRYGWLCASVIGAENYQQSIDAPLAPGSQLRNSYWDDFKMLQVLDILVDHNFPFSKTYLTKCKREESRVNGLIQEKLQQPAATIAKFFSAVASRHKSFSHFAAKAGVPFDISFFPEPCVLTYERVVAAIVLLQEAGGSMKSDDILNFYPTGHLKARWDAIFECEMTGFLVWRAARQLGYRFDMFVADVRRSQRKNIELTKGLIRQNPGRLASLRENLESKDEFTRRLGSMTRTEISIYHSLYDLLIDTTEVVTPAEAVIHLMSAFLMSETHATRYFRNFVQLLISP